MRLIDARRLRGPSLGADGPGAIAEVALDDGDDPTRVERRLRAEIERLAPGLGNKAKVRRFAGGLAVSVPTRIDALSWGADVLEAAVEHAASPRPKRRDAIDRLARAHRRERDPRLVALERRARREGVPFLFDDDVVSLGHGANAASWPQRELPAPSRVAWRKHRAIPVALVTGTNGKTTTTRLVARMAKLAGLVPGNTSSDGVAIDEVIVDAGDNTGGESARRVLRDPKVEIAILETARGGLLRRGLAVGGVDAALITNVTPDHLGEHGVLDLATLVDAKAVVGHAVNERGRVVLGADDPELVRIAPTFHATRVWFAATPESARAPLARGETTFLVERGAIVRAHRGKRTTLGKIVDMPITSGGTAPHNVKNALAAAALAWSLGLPDAAIRKGLRTFGRAPADNVGRGQIHTTASGVRVILDFGHNPGAARELYAWARALAGDANVLAVLTQPGDRDDAAMAAFAHEAATSGVSRAIVWEKDSLRRGRRAGSIARTLRRALGTSLPADRVSVAVDEASAIRAALAVADDGDVVVVSPSLDRVLPG